MTLNVVVSDQTNPYWNVAVENCLVERRKDDCVTMYLWKNHPLAKEESISMSMLKDYPCLSFEQNGSNGYLFAEEILSENIYPRMQPPQSPPPQPLRPRLPPPAL